MKSLFPTPENIKRVIKEIKEGKHNKFDAEKYKDGVSIQRLIDFFMDFPEETAIIMSVMCENGDVIEKQYDKSKEILIFDLPN